MASCGLIRWKLLQLCWRSVRRPTQWHGLPTGARGSGFFSRGQDKEKEEALAELDEPSVEPVPRHKHAKENLNLLATQGGRLDNRRGYKPPVNASERVQRIVEHECDVKHERWESVSLKDPRLKYKVLTKLMAEFKHDVPNATLTQLCRAGDAARYFQTEVHDTSCLEDLSKEDLPQNLVMKLEYQRFDPETDTMFGGRTAYPGSDTHVTSIKYKRKYKSIKTTKEKAGYVNHYYGW